MAWLRLFSWLPALRPIGRSQNNRSYDANWGKNVELKHYGKLDVKKVRNNFPKLTEAGCQLFGLTPSRSARDYPLGQFDPSRRVLRSMLCFLR
jgi:hypothetical protein